LGRTTPPRYGNRVDFGQGLTILKIKLQSIMR
jgi:hypothetical protein